MPSILDNEKIVIWLAENPETNIAKVKISNYSSTLFLLATPQTPFLKLLCLQLKVEF